MIVPLFVGGVDSVELVILVIVASVYAVVPAVLVYLAISRGGDDETGSETEQVGDGTPASTDPDDVSVAVDGKDRG
ncbi:MAG: hypothetical protein ACLFSW_00075 [Halobacteriales archaeon]